MGDAEKDKERFWQSFQTKFSRAFGLWLVDTFHRKLSIEEDAELDCLIEKVISESLEDWRARRKP